MLPSCNPREKVAMLCRGTATCRGLGTPEQGSALSEDLPMGNASAHLASPGKGEKTGHQVAFFKRHSLKGLSSLIPRQKDLQRDLPPIPNFGSAHPRAVPETRRMPHFSRGILRALEPRHPLQGLSSLPVLRRRVTRPTALELYPAE